MPEYHLTAKPACPPSAETRIGDFTINEVPLAIASVAAFEGGAGEAKLSEFLGFDAPGVAKWAENAGLSAFWAGPGQWFVTQAEEGSTPLVENLVDASGGDAAITDQSGGWTGFDISGPNLPAVLEKLVGFDADAAQSGDAVRTSIEHISSFVLIQAADEVRVFCLRSFARALHHAIARAMRSQLALAGTGRD